MLPRPTDAELEIPTVPCRIAWSNDRFGYEGTPGWMSDRGMVYTKFGPPDELEEHPDGEPATFPFQRWTYRYLDGVGADVTVEFVDRDDTGQYRMT